MSTEPSLVTIVLRRVGQLACRHLWTVAKTKDRIFLRCVCGAESEGFQIAGQLGEK